MLSEVGSQFPKIAAPLLSAASEITSRSSTQILVACWWLSQSQGTRCEALESFQLATQRKG